MSSKIIAALTVTSIVFLPFGFAGRPAIAQQELCRDAGYIPRSNTLRTLALPQFGINIDIPQNYRSLVKNNGSVHILDPATFETVSCTARGGKVLSPHGSWQLIVRLVKNPNRLDLMRLVKQERSSQDTYYRYNLEGTPVFIIASRGMAEAWFVPPGITKGVVVMSIACDCTVNETDIVRELNRTKLRRTSSTRQ